MLNYSLTRVSLSGDKSNRRKTSICNDCSTRARQFVADREWIVVFRRVRRHSLGQRLATRQGGLHPAVPARGLRTSKSGVREGCWQRRRWTRVAHARIFEARDSS